MDRRRKREPTTAISFSVLRSRIRGAWVISDIRCTVAVDCSHRQQDWQSGSRQAGGGGVDASGVRLGADLRMAVDCTPLMFMPTPAID